MSFDHASPVRKSKIEPQTMYKHLLLATDGSELARKALQHGLELAKAFRAKASIVTVTKPWPHAAYGAAPRLVDLYKKTSAENAKAILASASEAGTAAGVVCTTLLVEESDPAEAIVASAKQQDCDLIVMASHCRGALGRLLLGSETLKVLTLSTVPVLVCR
jgi:nucleotide-binding universal stress UspA family protein